MRLFEVEQKFGGLPKKAGVAVLNWKGRESSRKGNVITLPAHDEVQFFPLLDGVQFLIQTPDGRGEDNARAFFGGTDERPFLVAMEPEVLLALKEGEKGFYDAIKPEGAKFCEEKFGTKAIRQGDWFAVPIPLNWDLVRGLLELFSSDHEVVTKSRKGISIGGTRHLLIGGQCVALSNNHLDCAIIGEGLLRAPDHADKMLKGPHALFQTRYLKEPQKAD